MLHPYEVAAAAVAVAGALLLLWGRWQFVSGLLIVTPLLGLAVWREDTLAQMLSPLLGIGVFYMASLRKQALTTSEPRPSANE